MLACTQLVGRWRLGVGGMCDGKCRQKTISEKEFLNNIYIFIIYEYDVYLDDGETVVFKFNHRTVVVLIA